MTCLRAAGVTQSALKNQPHPERSSVFRPDPSRVPKLGSRAGKGWKPGSLFLCKRLLQGGWNPGGAGYTGSAVTRTGSRLQGRQGRSLSRRHDGGSLQGALRGGAGAALAGGGRMAAAALRLCRAVRLLPAAAATAQNTAPAPRPPPRLASSCSFSSASSASRPSPPQPAMQAFQYPEVYRDETAVSRALAGTAPACGGRRARRGTRGSPCPAGRLGAGVPPRLSGLCSAAAAERRRAPCTGSRVCRARGPRRLPGAC